MFSTKKINLNKIEKSSLMDNYVNGTSHELRQRSHCIILRNKSFSINDIALILEKNTLEIVLYIKGWNYLKENSLYLNLSELEREIINIERRKFTLFSFFVWILNYFINIISFIYKKIENVVKTLYIGIINLLYILYKALNYVFGKILNTIIFLSEKFWLCIVAVIGIGMFFVIKIGNIPFKKYYSDAKTKFFAKNFLKITKSNNNIIFQIINYNYNNKEKNNEKEEVIEDYSAVSMKETKEIFTKLFNSKKDYLNTDKILSLAFAVNEKIQSIQNEERRKRYLSILVTSIAFYVFYNTSIKSSILALSMLVTSITFSAIDYNFNNNIDTTSYTIDTTVIKVDSIAVDSARIKIDSIQKKLIKKAIPVFEGVSLCQNLTELGYKQLEYINLDRKNYLEENYYKYYPDNRLYVQVAVYQDIRHASFQRLNLLNEGFLNSKIIRFIKERIVYYSVSINDYNIEEYNKVCSEIDKWNFSCHIEKSKARILYNY
ncbi:MAG: hypothetical protein R3E32_07795 [Chitinophagales bacterium]